jgi:hypothetical protein
LFCKLQQASTFTRRRRKRRRRMSPKSVWGKRRLQPSLDITKFELISILWNQEKMKKISAGLQVSILLSCVLIPPPPTNARNLASHFSKGISVLGFWSPLFATQQLVFFFVSWKTGFLCSSEICPVLRNSWCNQMSKRVFWHNLRNLAEEGKWRISFFRVRSSLFATQLFFCDPEKLGFFSHMKLTQFLQIVGVFKWAKGFLDNQKNLAEDKWNFWRIFSMGQMKSEEPCGDRRQWFAEYGIWYLIWDFCFSSRFFDLGCWLLTKFSTTVVLHEVNQCSFMRYMVRKIYTCTVLIETLAIEKCFGHLFWKHIKVLCFKSALLHVDIFLCVMLICMLSLHVCFVFC